MKRSGRFASAIRWLYPGMHIKRWLLLLGGGITVLALGLAYFLRVAYSTVTFPPFAYYLTLQFLSRAVRGAIFGIAGVAAVVVALVQLNRSLLAAFLRPGQQHVAEAIYQHWQRDRGLKVVAIGGGTGLSTLLRGLKEHTDRITAIVTVADDGGSSGRLRRELGVLPPGDFRNCLAALANAESLTTQLFQYRFGEGMGLNGHSFGNLFIAAMAGVTGNFERAIVESSRVLAVRGRILPSTLENVTLIAELSDCENGGIRRVEGESQIPAAGRRIERLSLRPDTARAFPEALQAILDADLIIAGPGSLYTSVLPNLLVTGIADAIRASSAEKLYICNVATQPGETDRYTVGDHVAAIERHVGRGMFPLVLANDNLEASGTGAPVQKVRLEWPKDADYRVFTADLVDTASPWRHDSNKLARWLVEVRPAAVAEAGARPSGSQAGF